MFCRCEDLDPILLAPRAVAAVRWQHESRDRALQVRFAPSGHGAAAVVEPGAQGMMDEDAALEWYWTEAVPAGHIG